MKIFLISFKVQRVLLIQRDESEVTHHLFFGRMFRAWTNHKVNGKDHLKHRGLSPVLTALVKGYFSFFLWNLTDKPADRRFDLTRRFLHCQISQMAECCTACAVEQTLVISWSPETKRWLVVYRFQKKPSWFQKKPHFWLCCALLKGCLKCHTEPSKCQSLTYLKPSAKQSLSCGSSVHQLSFLFPLKMLFLLSKHRADKLIAYSPIKNRQRVVKNCVLLSASSLRIHSIIL